MYKLLIIPVFILFSMGQAMASNPCVNSYVDISNLTPYDVTIKGMCVINGDLTMYTSKDELDNDGGTDYPAKGSDDCYNDVNFVLRGYDPTRTDIERNYPACVRVNVTKGDTDAIVGHIYLDWKDNQKVSYSADVYYEFNNSAGICYSNTSASLTKKNSNANPVIYLTKHNHKKSSAHGHSNVATTFDDDYSPNKCTDVWDGDWGSPAQPTSSKDR